MVGAASVARRVWLPGEADCLVVPRHRLAERAYPGAAGSFSTLGTYDGSKICRADAGANKGLWMRWIQKRLAALVG